MKKYFSVMLKKPIFLLSLSIAIFVFLKNAWISEDAYILFRSIEQLFAGSGPVWNPHERVQVFTSPLWYWILAFAHLFSNNVYLNAIIVSFILWLTTTLIIKRILKNDYHFLMVILLLSASTAFFDYTSSGLENILAYFLITVYLLNYFKLFKINTNLNQTVNPIFHIKTLLIVFGLIICVRHDLALLLLPPTIYGVLKNIKILSAKQWISFSIIAFLPFTLYSLFSLIYYGFPFPNTAYAKLNTGISRIELMKRGGMYFFTSLKYDVITLLIILSSLGYSFLRSSKKPLKYITYGIMANLIYIFYIGGDFMQGRFLSYAYLISVVLLFKSIKIKSKAFISIVVGTYLIFYPRAPFSSPIIVQKDNIYFLDFWDERRVRFNQTSLYQYLTYHSKNKIFPNHHWSLSGHEFKKSSEKIKVHGHIGMFGYHSGTKKIILDKYALSDPLLAQMPVPEHLNKIHRSPPKKMADGYWGNLLKKFPVYGLWQVGHFPREIPKGYIESILEDRAIIADPNINEFYKKLKIMTQSKKLFTIERLKTILLFNLGAYNHLLKNKTAFQQNW